MRVRERKQPTLRNYCLYDRTFNRSLPFWIVIYGKLLRLWGARELVRGQLRSSEVLFGTKRVDT